MGIGGGLFAAMRMRRAHAAAHAQQHRGSGFGKIAEEAVRTLFPKLERVVPRSRSEYGMHVRVPEEGVASQRNVFLKAKKINKDHELREIQRLMNSPLRGVSPFAKRHYNDLRLLFLNGLAQGEIRNFKDFRRYLIKTAREQIYPHNPQLAQQWMKNSERFALQLERSFSERERKGLGEHFINLSIINTVGGDPRENAHN